MVAMSVFENIIINVLVTVIFLLVLAWPVAWALGLFGVALTYWQAAGVLALGKVLAAVLQPGKVRVE